MKKEKKLWRVFITKVERFEFDEKRTTIWKPYYRWGVSEKQVISRMRHEFDLYNHDEYDGQVAVSYEFDIEDAKPNGITTYTVFDFEW